MSSSGSQIWTCSRCLRAQPPRIVATIHPSRRTESRRLLSATRVFQAETPSESSANNSNDPKQDEAQGAMSRRLAEMAEETIDTGSRSDRKLIQDAGFSEDLKKQLEDRIAQTQFAAANQKAASIVDLPSSAGKGTQDIAGAEPWRGSESLHDSALRMLDDSHKRLRSPYRIPSVTSKVDLRPAPKKNVSAADRLANARDKTSIYAFSQQNDMSEKEREQLRKELKDRFSPGARPMPTTLNGLTSLANERIEDAIARGQFKNIPRGKGKNVERDYNANSPFLDTTEYFMNKIIQKQEIVPPWIEKQQELVKAVASFRGRLGNDWRRHAARMIASTGGSVDDQIRRAKGYALAEERVNPPLRKVENVSSISADGRLTSITVEERIAAGVPQDTVEIVTQTTEAQLPTASTTAAAGGDANGAATITDGNTATPSAAIAKETPTVTTTTTTSVEGISTALHRAVETSTSDPDTPSGSSPSPSPSQEHHADSQSEPPQQLDAQSDSQPQPAVQPQPQPQPQQKPTTILPMPHPFRDRTWEKAEQAYHTLAVKELNALTRSYNLMAPKIAQKPYFTLERELNRCFADVAPTLPDAILERSRKPTVKVSVMPHREGGVLERFGEGIGAERYRGHEGRIRDEVEGKGYGFREFWRDLFGSSSKGTGNGTASQGRSRRETGVA